MMNIEHVRLFIRVATTRNISLAGQELGLSPAVASAHLSKLEDQLGVRLIHRTTRKVSLTEEGNAFLPHAEDVLASIEAARSAVGAGNNVPTGHLRVTAPTSFGRMHLTPILKSFLATYPGITLDLRFSDSIVDMVEGGFDIAIRNAELKDSSLIARKLARDTRIICASPDYIEQHGEPKTPDELLNHQCITLMGLEQWQFNMSDEVKTIKTKGRVRTDSGEVVRDACVDGLGIAISSTWCSYQHIQRGQLIPILTNYPLAGQAAIWAVYPSSRLLAPKVRAFIDFVTEFFGKVPYWDQ